MTITKAQQTPIFYIEKNRIFETDLYSFVSVFVNPIVKQQGRNKKKYFVHYDNDLMLYCFSCRTKKGFITSFYFDNKEKAEEFLFSYLYNLLPNFYIEGKDFFFTNEIAGIEISASS